MGNFSGQEHTMLILLDRDGVINFDSTDYIKTPDEWRALPGALEAIVRLRQAGHHIAVCSNQAGVGRGIFNEAALALSLIHISEPTRPY